MRNGDVQEPGRPRRLRSGPGRAPGDQAQAPAGRLRPPRERTRSRLDNSLKRSMPSLKPSLRSGSLAVEKIRIRVRANGRPASPLWRARFVVCDALTGPLECRSRKPPYGHRDHERHRVEQDPDLNQRHRLPSRPAPPADHAGGQYVRASRSDRDAAPSASPRAHGRAACSSRCPPRSAGWRERVDAARTDTASTSWCPLSAAARARFRQPTQRSSRATQYHVLQWMRLNFPLQRAGFPGPSVGHRLVDRVGRALVDGSRIQRVRRGPVETMASLLSREPPVVATILSSSSSRPTKPPDATPAE